MSVRRRAEHRPPAMTTSVKALTNDLLAFFLDEAPAPPPAPAPAPPPAPVANDAPAGEALVVVGVVEGRDVRLGTARLVRDAFRMHGSSLALPRSASSGEPCTVDGETYMLLSEAAFGARARERPARVVRRR